MTLKQSNRIKTFIKLVIVLLFSSFGLFPFIWLFLTSLKPYSILYKLPLNWFDKAMNFSNYLNMLKEVPVFRHLFITFIVGIFVAILAVTISTGAGYILSHFSFRGDFFLTLMLLISQMLPQIVIMVPLYFLLLQLGLVNKLVGLVVVYTGMAIPFSTLMLRSYIETAYSKNLEDSARVDGCTYFQIYFHITVPLCMPGIAAVALFAFMIIYEEFMWANVLITRNSIKTIQSALYSFFGIYSSGTSGGIASAAGFVVTIPTIILAFFLQRYLVTGLTAGAVKE